MIRLVQRKLILPRGDTGSLTIPVLPDFNTGDVAVFAIFNPLNKTIIFKKQVEIADNKITIQFSHNETVNLPAGKYLWDIKAYSNPEYANGNLVNGDQIDSYYAGYKFPECQIKETSDNYLLADDAPTSTLSSSQLDLLSAILAELRDAVQKSQENVTHYPIIIDTFWYVWDADAGEYINTNVRSTGVVVEGTGVGSAKTVNFSYFDNGIQKNAAQFASGVGAFAEGIDTTAGGKGAHAQGILNQASGHSAHAEGYETRATNINAHSEGANTEATGSESHAEGLSTIASGNDSHAEGRYTTSSGTGSHSQGAITTADGMYSHAEGYSTEALGPYSHTEGAMSKAIKSYGHAEGQSTTANGMASHVEGFKTIANGDYSHAQGYYTIASEKQHVSGMYNVEDLNNLYAVIVGIGTYNNNRINGYTLDWYGNGYYAGKVSVNNTIPTNNNDLTSKEYVDAMLDLKADINSIPTNISDLVDDSNHYTKPQNGIPASDLAPGVIPDVSNKVDKVRYATAGNFASLDRYGNLVDSGHKHSDYLTEHQDISGKQDKLIFDDAPQLISNNPVTSKGLWSAFNNVNVNISSINTQISSLQDQIIGKQDYLYFDTQPRSNSSHPVTSSGIKTAIDTAVSTKQDILTFDTTPTQSSNNPVTSSGIKSALSGLEWSLSERANMIDDTVNDLQDDIVKHTMDISLLKTNVSNLETNKQNKLTFDITPRAYSNNPVTSGGIYDAITNIKTMQIHICTNEEYNSQTGIPIINSPDTKTFYLVPGGEGNNLYIEWVYINNTWEQFGSATIDLSDYAIKNEIPEMIFAPQPLIVTVLNGERAIRYNTGELYNSSAYNASDYVDLSGIYAIRYKRTKTTASSSAIGIAFYDASKAYANSGVQVVLNQEAFGYVGFYDVIVPEGAAYVRFTMIADTQTYGDFEAYGLRKTLIFDNTPTANSMNPVTSDGIKAAIPTKVSDLVDDSGHYTKPVAGIPASDLINGIIPDILENSTSQEKAEIRTLIGAENGDDIIKIQDTQPTESATKIWIPETTPQGVQVPTQTEFEAGMASKQDTLIFDEVPMINSDNPVKSNGIKTAIDAVQSAIPVKVSDLTNDAGYLSHDVFIPNQLFAPIKYEGSCVVYNTGNISGSSSFNATDYVSVENLRTIKYKRIKLTGATSTAGMAFYNSSKEFISGIRILLNQETAGYDDSYETVVPENAVYARFSMLANTQAYGEFEVYGFRKALAFDMSPTINSINAVTSGGVYTTLQPKADKVNGAIAGNLAALDANGNLTDSGKKVNDFLTSDTIIQTPISAPVKTQQRLINYSTGIAAPYDNLNASEYINVSSFFAIRYSRTKTALSSANNGIAFYDVDKNYISGIQTMLNQDGFGYWGLYDAVVPSDAKYARFTMVAEPEIYGEFELYGLNYKSQILGKEQNVLTFDSIPIANSMNSVTSNGIKQTIDTVYNQISGETDIKLLTKADRVSEYTEGNFTALDENGNLIDSGNKASDFLTNDDKSDIIKEAFEPMLLPASVLSEGYFVRYDNGGAFPYDNTTYGASSFVDVSGWSKIRYKRTKTNSSSSYAGMAFYYADKTFIPNSGVQTVVKQDNIGYHGMYEVSVPENAKYARFTMLTDAQTYGEFEVYGLRDTLAFDAMPTADSINAVTSGGVYAAISTKAEKVNDAVSGNFATLDENGNLTDSGNKASDFVTDVQVNGTSVLSNGVANVPIASSSTLGVMKTNTTYGLNTNANGELYTLGAGDAHIKAGDNLYRPITPGRQHQSVFYGLAKAAGDTTQSQSNNAVGTYTDEAKTAIRSMLGTISNADYASTSTAGVVKVGTRLSISSSGVLSVPSASSNTIKQGTISSYVLTPDWTHYISFYGLAKAAGDTTQTSSSNAVGTYTDEAKSAIKNMLGVVGNADYATSSTAGIAKVSGDYGLTMDNGFIKVTGATATSIKNGANNNTPITSANAYTAAFYGLAKAAGDTTQTSSSNAVGTYTETAQSKIYEMLDAPVTVSGTDPVITGKAGIRYICGECDTLTLTPPASGIVDVVFTSGTTPTVLSVPNTVKWPGWFNPSALDTSVTYELNIMDGVYGAVMAWT